MSGRLAALIMLIVFVPGARAATVAVPQRNENCFDLAVIARPPREFAIPGTSHPDDLIGHPTWRLDIPIERVLLGSEERKRVPALVVKHTQYNPSIKRWLFLLKRRSDGAYDEVGGDYRVITDNNGELVIPFTEPISKDWLFPAGPLPRSYQTRLKPVKYASRRTWWLREFDDVEPDVVDPAWAYRRGRYVVAHRGIYLSDWAEAMQREPGAICPKT